MAATYLNITHKHRRMIGYLADLADFTVSEGESVDPRIVLDSPNISLYCLDEPSQRAIFVELPPDVDLDKAPFVFQTQYEQAQRLVAVPYAAFRELAHELPPIEHLILIYMTARTGSTLLSNALAELDSVLSLSEPTTPTQLVHLRAAGQPEDDLRDLLDCIVRFTFKPTAFKQPTTYALKLRSETLKIRDLFEATFPKAKSLYLYRDANGWIASYYRIFRQDPQFMERTSLPIFLGVFKEFQNQDFSPLTAYLEPNATEISVVEILTLWWISIMEWYMAQSNRGFEILPVRYADLNAYGEKVLTAIFRYCELPIAQVPIALKAFAKDSQEGTALAREQGTAGNQLRLTDAQLGEIQAILNRHPFLKSPDFIVPGTLVIEGRDQS